MMSFLNPLRPFPQSFFLLPEKQVHTVLDVSGRKSFLKERWRGSIWGQKSNKCLVRLEFWFYVVPQFAQKPTLIRGTQTNLRESVCCHTVCCIHAFSLSPFLLSHHSMYQPLPPDFPPSFPTTLCLSFSVTLPFISFKGEGRHLIPG